MFIEKQCIVITTAVVNIAIDDDDDDDVIVADSVQIETNAVHRDRKTKTREAGECSALIQQTAPKSLGPEPRQSSR